MLLVGDYPFIHLAKIFLHVQGLRNVLEAWQISHPIDTDGTP
jgi:hypothetical protein